MPLPRDHFDHIAVAMRRPGLRISTRSGYYGESEAASPGTARLLSDPSSH